MRWAEPPAYKLIDTHSAPDFFSRYPAAISLDAVEIERILTRIVYEATSPGTKERRKGLVRYWNPNGNPFAICHSTARPERLPILASIVEVMWIHDDVTEELSHKSACEEHSKLAEVLRLDVDPSTQQDGNLRHRTLATLLRKAIDEDPSHASTTIVVLKNYLQTFDSKDDDFTSMAEYMPYRISNCGYWISSYFIRWGLGCIMSDEDYDSIRAYDIAMGNVLGLTNDYFSWNVEKDQRTDRVRNGVRVLMKEHSISADAARSLLLGLIVQEETRAAKLKVERMKLPVSNEIAEYFDAIELYVGGSCYWHATAPRYQVSERD